MHWDEVYKNLFEEKVDPRAKEYLMMMLYKHDDDKDLLELDWRVFYNIFKSDNVDYARFEKQSYSGDEGDDDNPF